jgi:hypothetical protein
MLDKLLSMIGLGKNSNHDVDSSFNSFEPDFIVQNIRNQEEQKEIPQGKQIFGFDHDEYSISVDREFTNHYRISVFIGNHKVYGFTINDKEISDEQFTDIFEKIISFLDHNPSVESLPDDKGFKSHFFGTP